MTIRIKNLLDNTLIVTYRNAGDAQGVFAHRLVFGAKGTASCDQTFAALGRASLAPNVLSVMEANGYIRIWEWNLALPLPAVNAGLDGAVQEPTDTYTLIGTADGATSHTWTFLSGPQTPTIASPSALTTLVTFGGSAGTYTFRLSGTNSSGTATDDIAIVVAAAAGPPNPSVTKTTGSSNNPHVGGYADLEFFVGDPGVGNAATVTLTFPVGMGTPSSTTFTRDHTNYAAGAFVVVTPLGAAGTYAIGWSVVSTLNATPSTGTLSYTVNP